MSGDSRHALSKAAIAESWGRAAQTSDPMVYATTLPCALRRVSRSSSDFGLASSAVHLHESMIGVS